VLLLYHKLNQKHKGDDIMRKMFQFIVEELGKVALIANRGYYCYEK